MEASLLYKWQKFEKIFNFTNLNFKFHSLLRKQKVMSCDIFSVGRWARGLAVARRRPGGFIHKASDDSLRFHAGN